MTNYMAAPKVRSSACQNHTTIELRLAMTQIADPKSIRSSRLATGASELETHESHKFIGKTSQRISLTAQAANGMHQPKLMI